MKSDSNNKDAINFLALVRQDLENLEPADTSQFAVATPSLMRSDFETLTSLPDSITEERVGRFKIIEQIGEGGFARVFVALDPNLDRAVAIKIPKPHALVSSEARSRFEREAKSAAILSHPNIVPVFESGSAGPICFIASEYCPGTNLRIWYSASKKKPAPRESVKIVIELADALQHAHRRGIIHRDLKPSNIIVVEGDEEITDRLRITDFGLARQISSEESLTANGAIIGTPAYMSPEQAEGIGKVDHRTDVYSLGMILYELLTGKVPFKRSSHIASIAAVINESVPTPRQFNRRLDADLEAICLKALNKEPANRYQSAHELKRDLQSWLDGGAVSVRKLSKTQIGYRWIKRNPVVTAAMLFSLLSLGTGFAFSFNQWKESQANFVQSEQQKDRAEKNAEELHKTIVGALESSLDSLEKRVQLLPAQQEILDQLMNAHIQLIEAEAEEVEATPETFESYERLARIYRNTGRYDKALEICEKADKLLKPYLEDNGKRRDFCLSAVDISIQKAYVFGDQGDRVTLLSYLLEAEQYYLDGEPDTEDARWLEDGYSLYRQMAFTYFADKEMEKSRAAFEISNAKAVAAIELEPENDQLAFNFAKSFCDISHVFREKQWRTGLEYLERSEELFEQAKDRFLNPESEIKSEDYRYRLAYIRNEAALYLRVHVKDYDRAEEYTLRAIDALKELTEENPGFLTYQNRLSHAYSRLISIYASQEMYDQVLELIPVAEEAHLKGMDNWKAYRIADNQIRRGKIWAFEYDDPAIAEEAFDKAVETIESSEQFDLSREHMVNTLIEAHRQRNIFYNDQGQSEKSIDAAASAYRLAVQRALKYPKDRNVSKALSYGKHYASRVFEAKQYGLAKTVLDTTAEASQDSAKAQYELAHLWAKFDSRQRDDGVDRNVWKTSRNRSMQLLSRAIDLGFSDYKRIQKGRYFNEYQFLPEFKAISERIKPDGKAAK